MTKQEAIARLEIIVANSAQPDGWHLTIKANDWAKNGKNRTYFSITETRDNSKHSKEKKYGYIDNVSGEYFPERLGDLRDNYDFSGAKF